MVLDSLVRIKATSTSIRKTVRCYPWGQEGGQVGCNHMHQLVHTIHDIHTAVPAIPSEGKQPAV